MWWIVCRDGHNNSCHLYIHSLYCNFAILPNKRWSLILLFEVEHCHVTCFGQWDMRKTKTQAHKWLYIKICFLRVHWSSLNRMRQSWPAKRPQERTREKKFRIGTLVGFRIATRTMCSSWATSWLQPLEWKTVKTSRTAQLIPTQIAHPLNHDLLSHCNCKQLSFGVLC